MTEHSLSSSPYENKVDSDPEFFYSKSGMEVNALADFWMLLPNKGKGYRLSVGWLHSSKMPGIDRKLILGILVYFSRSKAANTVSGLVCSIKPFVMNGIPSLLELKVKWNGLKINQKKSS